MCGFPVRVIDAYQPPPVPAASFEVRSGVGRAITEAPRGLLYHAFETDERGLIHSARIVPPTSQNQARIEADLRELVPDAATIAFLRNPNNPTTEQNTSNIQAAARKLGQQIIVLDASTADEIDQAFATIASTVGVDTSKSSRKLTCDSRSSRPR